MDHRPLVVYIAGPFRGSNSWIVEKNIRHAELVGFEVAECGHAPLILHSMYRFWNRTLTDDIWLGFTESLLRKCDAAVFIDGWEGSVGSVKEKELAKELKIPCYDCSDTEDDLTIEEWLKDIVEDKTVEQNSHQWIDESWLTNFVNKHFEQLRTSFDSLVISHNQLFALVLKLQKKIVGDWPIS